MLEVDNEEVILCGHAGAFERVTLVENAIIEGRSEAVVIVTPERLIAGCHIVMLESEIDDGEFGRGLPITKAVLQIGREIPVRLINLND